MSEKQSSINTSSKRTLPYNNCNATSIKKATPNTLRSNYAEFSRESERIKSKNAMNPSYWNHIDSANKPQSYSSSATKNKSNDLSFNIQRNTYKGNSPFQSSFCTSVFSFINLTFY